MYERLLQPPFCRVLHGILSFIGTVGCIWSDSSVHLLSFEGSIREAMLRIICPVLCWPLIIASCHLEIDIIPLPRCRDQVPHHGLQSRVFWAIVCCSGWHLTCCNSPEYFWWLWVMQCEFILPLCPGWSSLGSFSGFLNLWSCIFFSVLSKLVNVFGFRHFYKEVCRWDPYYYRTLFSGLR